MHIDTQAMEDVRLFKQEMEDAFLHYLSSMQDFNRADKKYRETLEAYLDILESLADVE